VVRALLWTQCGLFLIDYVILPLLFPLQLDDYHKPPMVTWGAFTIGSAILEGQLWKFLTFQFLHDSVGHLLFNSMGLYFFGPWVERWWGGRKFLLYYLLCGSGGALLFTILTWLGWVPGTAETGLIGASAGIYGILVGVAAIAPSLRVMLLFPPIELSMRQLALALMVLSIVFIITGVIGNEGGEAGHLGGFLMGYVLMTFPKLMGSRPGPAMRSHRQAAQAPPKLRPRTISSRFSMDPEIDRILDKISREGFASVTPEERETLDRAARTPPHEP
jgi:membrane associated rhomboid family serine protease